MKLLIDMNLSPRWLDTLADAGFQAVHWSAVGKASAPDLEIADYAAANGFVILTNDLDFAAILAISNRKRPSVIQLRAHDLSPSAIGPIVVRAIWQVAIDLESGALLTIEPGRTRLRLLPL